MINTFDINILIIYQNNASEISAISKGYYNGTILSIYEVKCCECILVKSRTNIEYFNSNNSFKAFFN